MNLLNLHFFYPVGSYLSLPSFQAALISSLEMPKADIWVMIAILSGLGGYCAKIYFT